MINVFVFKARYVLLVSIIIALLVLLIKPIDTCACYDPSNMYAIEIVLNYPGLRYNLTRLFQYNNTSTMVVYDSTYSFKLIYRHFNRELVFLVTLYEEEFIGNKPVLYMKEDFSYENVSYYLGIRLELYIPR